MAALRNWGKHMATLYLTEPRSLVKKDGETLLVEIPADRNQGTQKRKVRVPLIKIDSVVVYGDVTLTSPALVALLQQRAEVCFCSHYGRFRGRLSPEFSKNSLLRLAQHRVHADPVRSLCLAQAFVRGKLSNMRTLLLRTNRKRQDGGITAAAASIKGMLDQVDALPPHEAALPPDPARPQAGSLQGTLLGLEGAASAAYFGVFGHLLKGDWEFARRRRRPPTDPVNALLSYGYVLLTHQVASAVNVVGLDPYVGFLHSSQYGKPALALDVVEEFRAPVVDSVVLTLLNNGMLTLDDFEEKLGAWRLTEAGRRTFLTRFEERLNETITHPVFGYKAAYRRCLELQVRLVAKWLTEEIAQYKPFVIR
jgi:CRISPR-associated protein Cas1